MNPDITEAATGVAAALAAGAALGQPRTNPDQHGIAYTLVPKGFDLRDLPERATPTHPKGLVKLRDCNSFIRYVNDHQNPESRIFASLEPARFLCIFDEHQPHAAKEKLAVSDQANWREFRCEFAPPASREWQLWNKANRQHMSQLSFAEFLQDNLPDVATPTGADLLEMSLKFEASQSGQFISAQRLQDGSHEMVWKADNSGGTVKLPEFILLKIPVFENDALQDVSARLRYRAKDGNLALWFELVRPHKVLEAAFRGTWERIATETPVPILLGAPE